MRLRPRKGHCRAHPYGARHGLQTFSVSYQFGGETVPAKARVREYAVDDQRSRAPLSRALSLSTKVLYGVGSTAYGVKENGFRTLLLLYYNQVLGLPVGLVATAILIALVIDGIVDPLIGQLSDTWHSRFGRRH